jgi:hypothetical protein
VFKEKVNLKIQSVSIVLFCLLLVGSMTGVCSAQGLFRDRHIRMDNDDNHIFSIGVTGTTAGYHFTALIENAKQQSISLGAMGYWELVPDPPSSLRNYDLQLIIRNHVEGKFEIEFKYDREKEDIRYRVKSGRVRVTKDSSGYYPALTIASAPEAEGLDDGVVFRKGARRILFFDFNSFDSDLRKYYGKIKALMDTPDYIYRFYCYESGNYDSYYFKTFDSVGMLDTDKMGLSLEDGSREYYQRVLDNLKSLLGVDFADQVIIVSKFGRQYARDLKRYAHEIGMNREMVVTFWSYDDIE